MFIELRTARTGPMPDQACAPSRQFRWHGRPEKRKFAFAEILHEECESIPPNAIALPQRDPVTTDSFEG